MEIMCLCAFVMLLLNNGRLSVLKLTIVTLVVTSSSTAPPTLEPPSSSSVSTSTFSPTPSSFAETTARVSSSTPSTPPVTTSSSSSTTTIYVGVLLELTDYWFSPYGSFFMHVFDHVFKEVEAMDDILPGYKFEMIVKDTKGHDGLAATKLIELFSEEEHPVVAVIGPTRSDSLTVTGQITPLYHTIQLSCVAVTSTTANSANYPTLIRVNQASDLLSGLRIRMMKQFRWTKIGSIVYQDDISVSQMTAFHEMLEQNNMTLLSSAAFSTIDNIRGQIASFKESNIRIIMVAVHGQDAAALFCEAYKQGLYGSSYVWILSGPTLHNGWLDDVTSCTRDELYEAVDGSFTLHNMFRSYSDEPTITGKSPQEEVDELKVLLESLPYRWSVRVPWAFDTAWSLAVGLNNSIRYLSENNLTLSNYRYSDQHLQAILHGMRDVNFTGVSGPVSFKNGARRGMSMLEQYRKNESVLVAYYDSTNDVLSFTVPIASLWKGGVTPKDSFTYSDNLVTCAMSVLIAALVFICLGCIISVTVLVFNIHYRNSRTIKMSSPVLNNVMIAGCILMYGEGFVNIMDNSQYTNTSLNCMVRTWLSSIAFTLLFGTLFAKTYRVYIIFRENRVRSKFIKDYHLFGVVGVLLLVDCLILVPWTLLFPLYTKRVTDVETNKVDNNVIVTNIYLYCDHGWKTYWLLTIYVYKGLLLAFGVFLAWETRNVTVPELNDSRYIGACIYNVVIICIFGVPLAHFLPIEEKTLTFFLESCLIFFCTTICQCLLFIPKIQGRNKVNTKMFQVPSVTQTGVSGSSIMSQVGVTVAKAGWMNSQESPVSSELPKSLVSDPDNNVAKLEQEVQRLRYQMAKEMLAVSKLKQTIQSQSSNLHIYRSGDEYIVCQRPTPAVLFGSTGETT